ncbi:helix-turn-helix domain-containing protein [Streptomyces sp. NPDC001933]|uniref:helix-turn-helix domain-containing protein n=1 Tax=Streptomyces sp. NPDC001933 TaxID=3364626 RepID=UPI003697A6ED
MVTRKTLAEAVGISEASLSRFLSGHRPPPPHGVKRCCRTGECPAVTVVDWQPNEVEGGSTWTAASSWWTPDTFWGRLRRC